MTAPAARKWGFLGCGNLAQALIGGALAQKLLEPERVFVADLDAAKIRNFARATGVSAAASNDELVRATDVIVVATKPQDIAPALDDLSKNSLQDKVVISLAAGVSSRMLEDRLRGARTLARVMANTPAMVQKGLFGITFIQSVPEDEEMITSLFEKLGRAVIVPGDKEINAITSASASGAGFVLRMIEEFETWLKKKGFDPAQARLVAVETFLGASALAKVKSETSLSELREAITSKKGTTLAGLQAMKAAKVPQGLRDALDAAYQRAVEISKSLLKMKK